MATGIKEIEVAPNLLAYRCIQWLIENGCVTEANLAALTTFAGFKAACNAVVLPEISKHSRFRALDFLEENATTLFTDANVTTAGAAALNARIPALRNIFIARDSTLTANTPAGLPE